MFDVGRSIPEKGRPKGKTMLAPSERIRTNNAPPDTCLGGEAALSPYRKKMVADGSAWPMLLTGDDERRQTGGTAMKIWTAIALAALLAGGCTRRTEREASKEQTSVAGAQEVNETARQYLRYGDTDGAVRTLAEALDGDRYTEERPWLFANLLDVLLRAGQVKQARERLLTAVKDEADHLVGSGFGMVYRYYDTRGEKTNQLEWTETLLGAGLPVELKPTVAAWHLQAVYSVKSLPAALALIPGLIEDLPENDARTVLAWLAQTLMAGEDHDGLAKLMDEVKQHSSDRPALQRLVHTVSTDLLLARRRWRKADKLFRSTAAALSDDELGGSLRSFVKQAGECGELARAEKLCKFILDDVRDKPRARLEAAVLWVAVAEKQNQTTSIPNRIGKLMQMDMPLGVTYGIFRSRFYTVVNTGNHEAISHMMKLGDSLSEALDNDRDRQTIRSLQLDGSFTMEDYALSIRLVEEGIAGRDKKWHSMALNKIKAHLALKEGRQEEAIERFRAFMADTATKEAAEVDPSTGVKHTHEMTLGRNAKRIGDIYTSMGKKEEADRAYEEAAGYFARALSTVEPDGRQSQFIRAEMAGVPGGK